MKFLVKITLITALGLAISASAAEGKRPAEKSAKNEPKRQKIMSPEAIKEQDALWKQKIAGIMTMAAARPISEHSIEAAAEVAAAASSAAAAPVLSHQIPISYPIFPAQVDQVEDLDFTLTAVQLQKLKTRSVARSILALKQRLAEAPTLADLRQFSALMPKLDIMLAAVQDHRAQMQNEIAGNVMYFQTLTGVEEEIKSVAKMLNKQILSEQQRAFEDSLMQ